MASKLSIHPGLRSLTGDLMEAAILSICIDAFLKGSSEAIMVGDLADETAATIAEVADALSALQDANLVDNPGKPWNEVSSFRITGISFFAACEQPMLFADAGEDTRGKGFQVFTQGADEYYATLEEADDLGYLLTIRLTTQDPEDEHVECGDGQTRRLTPIATQVFESPGLGWIFVDKFIESLAEGAAEAQAGENEEVAEPTPKKRGKKKEPVEA